MSEPSKRPPLQRQNLDVDYIEGATHMAVEPHPGERIVKVSTDSSARLRDIAGKLDDLNQTVRLIDKYEAVMRQGDAGREIEDSLWKSALTTYARAWGTGVRNLEKLDLAAFKGLDGKPLEVHQYFIDLRDKYVAHSVNANEQGEVFALLTDATGVPRKVLRVGNLQLTTSPLNDGGIAALRSLALVLIESAQARVDELSAAVFGEVEAMDLGAVYLLPDLVLPVPMAADVASNRNKQS